MTDEDRKDGNNDNKSSTSLRDDWKASSCLICSPQRPTANLPRIATFWLPSPRKATSKSEMRSDPVMVAEMLKVFVFWDLELVDMSMPMLNQGWQCRSIKNVVQSLWILVLR